MIIDHSHEKKWKEKSGNIKIEWRDVRIDKTVIDQIPLIFYFWLFIEVVVSR